MGRPKGSKNGVRRVPIKVPKNPRKKKKVPVFDEHILMMFKSTYYSACIESIDQHIENNRKTGENMSHYKVLQAAAFIQLGDQFKAAHDVLDKVISEDPSYSSAYFNKGVAYFCEKKYEQSLEMLEKALSLDPEVETDRVSYFKMRIECNRRDVKVEIERMAGKQENYNGNIIKRLKLENDEETDDMTMIAAEQSAVSYSEFVRDFEGGVKNCNKTLNVDPFGNILEDVKASTILPEAVPHDFLPLTARDFYAKGLELYNVGMLKVAQEKFEKAFEMDPSFTDAITMADKADELADQVFLAGSNLNMKNYKVVTDIVKKGLEVDPNNHFVNRMLYYYRGMAFYELGEKAKCDQDYAEYQKLDKILN